MRTPLVTRPTADGDEPSVRPPVPAQLVTGPGAAPVLTPMGLVGNTPVLWIGEPFTGRGRGFWAKLEGFNPGGIKDRAALHMLSRARERGALPDGGMVIESTSGTLGLGLALAGIVYGHRIILVSDPGMEPMMRRLLTAYGAHLDIVDTPHPDGGWQQARRERVEMLRAAHPGSYCPDQYHNPDNVAGYAGLAYELVAQLGWIDILVCSVGTGGHSAGISQPLRAQFPQLRLVGVDTIGSTIFGQPARPRLMRGLGSSIYPRNVAYGAFDEVHWVAPAEAVWACRQLAAVRYASGGWSVGAVALVAGWLAHTQPADTRIVAVFPDGPHRYVDTVYNDAYCEEHNLLRATPAPEPDIVAHPGDREVLRWTRCTMVIDPLPGRAETPQPDTALVRTR